MLHRGSFVEFRVDTVERTDGTRATRDFAGHRGAVAIVALDAAGRVALVRQWRLAADDALLEIPAGGLNLTDDGAKEDPTPAAARELEEETGLRAGSWRKLGEFYSAPGFTDELMHLYLATDLAPADPDGRLGPDEDERLILEWLPWQDAVALAETGGIRDAKSIVGLFWLARVMAQSEIPGGDTPVGKVARATYRMTMKEIVLANVAVLRRSLGTRLVGLFAIAAGSIGFLILRDVINALIALMGISLVTGWFMAPIAWYQARRRPDLLRSESVIVADDRGIRMASPLYDGHASWDTFRAVHETSRFLFLDTNSGLNYMILKRGFEPADLATLYRHLERNGLLKSPRGGAERPR